MNFVVFTTSHRTEVLFSVIESVSVLVVTEYFSVAGNPQDLSMEIDQSAPDSASPGYIDSSIFVVMRVPSEPLETHIVLIINDRCLTFCQSQ